MRRDAGYRFVRRIGEDHEAVRHGKAGLFEAGTVESLASNTRQISGIESIEGSKRVPVSGHGLTLLHCYVINTLKMQSWPTTQVARIPCAAIRIFGR